MAGTFMLIEASVEEEISQTQANPEVLSDTESEVVNNKEPF